MNCARCGAPLPFGSSFCAHCRVAHDADLRVLARPPVREGPSERSCPRCGERLEAWKVDAGEPPQRLELDRCASCAGLFFDLEELEAVLRAGAIAAPAIDRARLDELLAATRPDPDAQIRYVPCPECGALMHRKSYGARSGVVVDRCAKHGIWLDGGELRRLLHWRRAGGELLDEDRRREREAEREREERVRMRTSSTTTGVDRESRPEWPWWLEVLTELLAWPFV